MSDQVNDCGTDKGCRPTQTGRQTAANALLCVLLLICAATGSAVAVIGAVRGDESIAKLGMVLVVASVVVGITGNVAVLGKLLAPK